MSCFALSSLLLTMLTLSRCPLPTLPPRQHNGVEIIYMNLLGNNLFTFNLYNNVSVLGWRPSFLGWRPKPFWVGGHRY